MISLSQSSALCATTVTDQQLLVHGMKQYDAQNITNILGRCHFTHAHFMLASPKSIFDHNASYLTHSD